MCYTTAIFFILNLILLSTKGFVIVDLKKTQTIFIFLYFKSISTAMTYLKRINPESILKYS